MGMSFARIHGVARCLARCLGLTRVSMDLRVSPAGDERKGSVPTPRY